MLCSLEDHRRWMLHVPEDHGIWTCPVPLRIMIYMGHRIQRYYIPQGIMGYEDIS